MKKLSRKQKKLGLIIIAAVALTSLAIYAKLRQSQPTATNSPTPPGTSSSTSPTASVTTSPGAGGAETVPTSPATTAPATNPDHSGADMAKPTETINKHSISLSSGSEELGPHMKSTCTTLVGATCHIRMTGPGGVIKNLDTQTVDSQNGTAWDWNANTVGLTQGQWTLVAIASKDGQTATSDSTTLQVSQ